jgi:hypothetical protein
VTGQITYAANKEHEHGVEISGLHRRVRRRRPEGARVETMPGYPICLKTQHAAGTLFNTYTTAKSVINAQALHVVPANFLQVGDMLEIDILGGISNIVTTPGLMNFQVKMGSVVAADTGNVQLNATAHTTLPFWIKWLLTLRSDGPGATAAQFMHQAFFHGVMFTRTAAQTDGANSETLISGPATAPALGTAFDQTVANILDQWAGFTISNAGNGVQVQQYRVLLHSERN